MPVLLRKSVSAGSCRATEPHPCLRTKAQIRIGGSALRRGTAFVHHWTCGTTDHAPATRHRLGARAVARPRPGPCRRPNRRPGARDAAVHAGRACDLAAGRTRSRRWRHRLGLIDLGIGMPAQGTVKLSELASIVGPRQQPVMRDLYSAPRARCRNTPDWLSRMERSRTEHV